jgi:hypothetical protein
MIFLLNILFAVKVSGFWPLAILGGTTWFYLISLALGVNMAWYVGREGEKMMVRL